jgi:hypothetical protein
LISKTFILSNEDNGESGREYMEFIERKDINIKGQQRIKLSDSEVKVYVYYIKK